MQPPPRWTSAEFVGYYVVMAFTLVQMVRATLSLSSELAPNYANYRHRLSPGWIFGRKVDVSDAQYRKFRSGLPQLAGLAAIHIGLSRLAKASRLTRHAQTAISLVILIILHGASSLKILIILGLNYALSTSLAPQASSVWIWAFNLAILFSNDYWNGYKFRHLGFGLSVLDDERFKGLIPRWHVSFNITILRLISFGLDYHWASRLEFTPPHHSLDASTLSEKDRCHISRPKAEYRFQNYFNYVLYPPLYIAGPIISFNNFISQVNKKPHTINGSTLIRFTARFVVCFLTLEWILHYMYVVAIKDSKAWIGDSTFELSLISYWNLTIVWLKLLIPWRFFRLWALLDDVDPPENMIRCMTNNFSALGFWRSWHRSYNLWIVRYLYIPLGGNKNPIVSTILIFTFVALWHDLSLTLLTWGWLISFFVLPEIFVRKVFENSPHKDQWYFRHVKALGGTFNVLSMMSANLIGFCIGLEGVKFMWSEILGSWSGFFFLLKTLFVFFCTVQVMMEYREDELRRGIIRKC